MKKVVSGQKFENCHKCLTTGFYDSSSPICQQCKDESYFCDDDDIDTGDNGWVSCGHCGKVIHRCEATLCMKSDSAYVCDDEKCCDKCNQCKRYSDNKVG